MAGSSRILTTRQVASRTGLDHDTIGRKCRAGLFPGSKQRTARREWAIPETAVRRFLDRRKAAKKAARRAR